MGTRGAELVLLLAGVLLGFIIGSAYEEGKMPRYVGIGCEGSRGELYAIREGDFPHCDNVMLMDRFKPD